MIKAIITDFDGTLVDTFAANLAAYQQAFAAVGLQLTPEQYRQCFGLRFDDFMRKMNITDPAQAARIRQLKADCYPQHFSLLRLNEPLARLIQGFHALGGLTAIASTARERNLMGALSHFQLQQHFGLILAGEQVTQGKPSPEIYLTAMRRLHVTPQETLVFEDSPVGFQAAQAAGANLIKINIE